ncbi:hypothetical protein [Glutamicibacter arilaitensis]|uniref:hypothetical protein n=1 Tax=Glutamicibacter arilaitensis TaxID=256701 RepID=UPI003A8DF10F
MNAKTAAPVSSIASRIFLIAGAAGALFGVLALLALFWEVVSDGFAGGFQQVPVAAALQFIAIACGIGLAVGLLCACGMYVALEIRAARNEGDRPARQAAYAALGAGIGGLLPASILMLMGGSAGQWGLLSLIALGFLAVCSAAGYLITAGLNCQHQRSMGF